METLAHDLRYAWRTLRKTPVVTAAALLSLALGIGANTTIFTLINAIFLRPLEVRDPDTLVRVYATEDAQQLGRYMQMSRLNFVDLRERTGDVFTSLVDVIGVPASVTTERGEPERVFAQLVGGAYFDTLGVKPLHGRTFQPHEDAVPGTHHVVVLDYRFWSRRLAADTGVIGTTLSLNRQPFTVIGVMPPEFTGMNVLGGPAFWVPTMTYQTFVTGEFREWFEQRRPLLSDVVGRLRPGVTVARAQAVVESVGRALADEYPAENKNRYMTLLPLSLANMDPQFRENFQSTSWGLLAVVALVLLIACVNVANLLLGRAQARRREIAVRLALGAPRRRLLRQLLTESLLLAGLAGGLALLIAHWGRNLIWSLRPPNFAQTPVDLSFDPAVLLFTALVSVVTGLLFGLVPALQGTRPGIVGDLAQASDGASGAVRVLSLKNALVVFQVALSFVVLIGAGLFLRSLRAASEVELGFDPDPLAVLGVDLGTQGLDRPAGEAFFDRMIERVATVPGVRVASLGTSLPMNGGGMWRTVLIEGRDPDDVERNRIMMPANTVGEDYFRTVGISLLRGRDFTIHDRADAALVAIVNQAMAERFWPGEDPLGKRFQYFDHGDWRQVVGVVSDSKYGSIGEDPQPQTYVPRWQNYVPAMTLVMRVDGDAAAVLASARGEVQRLDPALPITGARTLREAVAQSLWGARMGAGLLGILGILAVVLASIGIYGVMASSVAQRRREIAVRMALGARRRDVVALVLRQGMTIVACGLVAGALVALPAAGRVAGLLYVSPRDFQTFAAVLLTLVTVALLANLLPARRAAQADPVVSLRWER